MEHYKITLAGYYPDNETKGKKKGESIGGIVRYTNLTTLEQCINEAREMWKDWVKKYEGSMIEIWIHKTVEITPTVGTLGALFHKDNFKKFREGSKASEGTPF